MNLWVKNSGLLIAVALFLFSCDDPTDLGDSINPNGDKVGVFYAEIPVSPSVVLLDSINTTNNDQFGSFLVGKYIDPDFGLISTTSYAQFLPVIANPKVPDGLVIDSVVLYLRQNYFYGDDFNGSQTIDAHLLREPLDSAKTYYSLNTVPYQSEPLVSKNFKVNPNEDTLLKISFPVSTLYYEWLQHAKGFTGDFSTARNFFNNVNGMALTPGTENSVVLGFNPYHSSSKISVFYHTSSDTSTVDFNFQRNFKVNPGTSGERSYNLVQSFTNVESDRTGTALEGITPKVDFVTNDNYIYMQEGTGIVPKVNLENFDNFIDTVGNVIINKIEIETGAISPFSKFQEPPAAISYYFTDETNKIILRSNTFRIPNTPTEAVVSGISNETYNGQITNYVDQYLNQNFDVRQFLLYPTGIGSSLKRAKIPSDKLKLKIYYTKLN